MKIVIEYDEDIKDLHLVLTRKRTETSTSPRIDNPPVVEIDRETSFLSGTKSSDVVKLSEDKTEEFILPPIIRTESVDDDFAAQNF